MALTRVWRAGVVGDLPVFHATNTGATTSPNIPDYPAKKSRRQSGSQGPYEEAKYCNQGAELCWRQHVSICLTEPGQVCLVQALLGFALAEHLLGINDDIDELQERPSRPIRRLHGCLKSRESRVIEELNEANGSKTIEAVRKTDTTTYLNGGQAHHQALPQQGIGQSNSLRYRKLTILSRKPHKWKALYRGQLVVARGGGTNNPWLVCGPNSPLPMHTEIIRALESSDSWSWKALRALKQLGYSNPAQLGACFSPESGG
ncbi:hypothetical protein LCI18_004313 [Fusarium solani-melongenae]|uniref:Uncharacterized protein n=1 Tax=Fusarium solani subsp. cucurbitae TaxID=2747967 RepID=A0ACD3YZU0_FUSSC|nr:hypothetical protein LCI18_004313 [Fusarium solani-melongenae]